MAATTVSGVGSEEDEFDRHEFDAVSSYSLSTLISIPIRLNRGRISSFIPRSLRGQTL
jgi:hypothetical protein